MKKIEAKIVADSISEQGHRITTMLLTYPRFIHSELMTHRMFSRNSASSRAIPFKKMVKMVEEDPFIPIAWQKDHKGMQGVEYITESQSIESKKRDWLTASKWAINQAEKLNHDEWGFGGVTKQLCNRLLEPFMWHTVLVTATEWDNFFKLRCPQYVENYLSSPESVEWSDITFKSKKDAIKRFPYLADFTETQWRAMNESQAEIHIQALAEAMWDAMNESTPKQLKVGEWHIPFGDDIEMSTLDQYEIAEKFLDIKSIQDLKTRIAVARCARLSYMTHEGKIDYDKDIALHDHLLASGHFSPFEHVAKCMSEEEYYDFVKGVVLEYESRNKVFSESAFGWCNNFRGWIPYRYLIEGTDEKG